MSFPGGLACSISKGEREWDWDSNQVPTALTLGVLSMSFIKRSCNSQDSSECVFAFLTLGMLLLPLALSSYEKVFCSMEESLWVWIHV